MAYTVWQIARNPQNLMTLRIPAVEQLIVATGFAGRGVIFSTPLLHVSAFICVSQWLHTNSYNGNSIIQMSPLTNRPPGL